MPFLALLSTQGRTDAALNEVARQFAERWDGSVDLAVVFFSGHHLEEAESLARRLQELFQPRAPIGCPGESIVGNDREIEEAPALSVWLGRWPSDVRLTPFHVTFEQTVDGMSLFGLPDELHEADAAKSLLLMLGDPFTFPTDEFLQQLHTERKGLPIIGGMASASREPGANRLLLGGSIVDQGGVGVLLEGPIKYRSVVSQGCRPIGKPFVITKAHHNLILELGGKPALGQLQELWQTLPPEEQSLIQQGLHVGRVISEYQESFRRGDFLVRNVMGIDKNTGGIAITDRVRVGQTVQFHVRDAATADEDLRLLLRMSRGDLAHPAGGLLFTCNGRGTRLFSAPNHDARAIHDELGPIPLAGFFAMGELGPIGGSNFIHGFTASVVLFED
jgi:small ligand-binding sensory domain FIST